MVLWWLRTPDLKVWVGCIRGNVERCMITKGDQCKPLVYIFLDLACICEFFIGGYDGFPLTPCNR